ncbi:hypothetical protein AN958_00171, partial [Leucoagaricus sp. SymC.cos]
TSDDAWKPISMPISSGAIAPGQAISKFQIITWNIDFSTPYIHERTVGILNCIQNYLLSTNAQTPGLNTIPPIILLQEVDSSAFPALVTHPFIQNNYDLTDISARNFESDYGTITCVPHALTPFVTAITRIPFENSAMGRDALTLDLDLPHFPNFRRSFPCQPVISRIRICNTHLESLRGHGDRARPEQLRVVSQLLFCVDGGLVVGDMNCIAPTDHEVPSRLGLIDAWEVLHPQDPPEVGYTWGYQPPRKWYCPARLDKVLYSGELRPVSIERFGIGQTIGYDREYIWLSDHYGLVAEFLVG